MVLYGGMPFSPIGNGPSMGQTADWNRDGAPQPRPNYVTDFRNFVDNAHPTFDYFAGLVYPMTIDNNLSRMDMNLHVYGAMETGWCTGCIFTNKTTDTCFQYNLSGGTTITGHTPFREWSVQNNYTGNTVGYWTNQTGDVYMSGGTAVTGYTAFTFVSPCVGELIESGTVLAAGGTLSAITQTNPYADGTALGGGSPGVILSGTNVHTGYMGAGLKNFGWGWKPKGVPEACHQNQRLIRNCGKYTIF